MGWDRLDLIKNNDILLKKNDEFQHDSKDDFLEISERIDHVLSQRNLSDTSVMLNPQNNKKIKDTSSFKAIKMDASLPFLQKPVQENKKTVNKTTGKNKNKTEEYSSTRTEKNAQNPDYKPNKSKYGWKDLGRLKISFNKEKSEYIYTVEEPELTDQEIQLKKKLEYLFRIHTDVDVSHRSENEKRDHLIDILDTIIESNNITIEPDSKDKIYYYIIRQFIGYGKIDILMKDDEIEDVSCDGPDIPIFIFHRKLESLRTNIKFDESDELDDFVFKLSQICGKQISIYEPIVDGRLPDGSRLQATLGKTVTKGSTFTIRRINENPLTPIHLIENKTLTAEMAAYFWFLLQHGVSILFCGGTASGKTTLLNAMSLFLPPTYKIVSVEDTREINLPHDNWIAGTTRQGFISSGKEQSSRDIDMFDLVKAALRQRPQVIIVGEVRGKEANTMFQAMATGHLSYSTMHANDMQTLIQRLENHPIDLPRSLMVSLDIVVFIKAIKTVDGKTGRRIKEVIELVKMDPDTNRLITINPFSYSGPLEDMYINHKNSHFLKNSKKFQGWSEEALYDELKQREQILEWMLKKKIYSYKDVGKIVSMYTKDPESIRQLMRE